MTKVLFVCLGNICRSPAAEGVFSAKIEALSKADYFKVDSAGTSAHHVGESADSRMIEHALYRGIDLKSISRKFIEDDFLKFDIIVGMDDSNIKNIKLLDNKSQYEHKIFKMTDFLTSTTINHVPDPYFGGSDGFELVLNIIDESCDNLIKYLENKKAS